MKFVKEFSLKIILMSICLENVFGNCGCNSNRGISLKNQISRRTLFFKNIIPQDTCSDLKHSNMTFVPAGVYEIGTTKRYLIADKELLVTNVTLKSFFIDTYEVTNRQFHEFVKATNYVTEAEKFGDSFVFKSFLRPEIQDQYQDFRVVGSPWWYKIPSANWFKPEGKDSDLNSPDRWNHPVVHVSWNDAVSYCTWRNGRLPTEQEWEVACKGKKRNKLYPWGNKLVPQGKHRMNVWQGQFPYQNSQEDGWVGTSPVGHYPPNDFGLFDITGNVWEWTSDHWDSYNLNSNERVKKGGSYLCHESYCNRYRCSARSQNTADSTAGNLGFRCCLNL